MKTLLFKYALVAILATPLMVSANGGKLNGKYTKEKTITRNLMSIQMPC